MCSWAVHYDEVTHGAPDLFELDIYSTAQCTGVAYWATLKLLRCHLPFSAAVWFPAAKSLSLGKVSTPPI